MWWLAGLALALAATLAVVLARRRRGRADTQQWSLADKLQLTGIVSSTAVGLLGLSVTVLSPGPGPGGENGGGTTSPPAGTDLRLASVTVQDSTAERPAPALDLKLRNVGSEVAVLTAVTMTVRSYGVLAICEAGGPLVPTATYPVALPAPAAAGDVVTAPIGQELAPNTADSFALTIGTRDVGLPAGQPAGFHVYVVDLAIEHDGELDALPAGAAVLLVPAITGQADAADFSDYLVDESAPTFDETAYEPVLPCYRSNRELLEEAMAVDGARPPALVATPGLG